MTAAVRAANRLPPPTMAERAAAARAATALRAAMRDPAAWGDKSTAHLDLSRPRRAEWITSWSNLPGLSCINGAYGHALLPGWTYTLPEIEAEMVPDLETLAERGVRPTEATAAAAAGRRAPAAPRPMPAPRACAVCGSERAPFGYGHSLLRGTEGLLACYEHDAEVRQHWLHSTGLPAGGIAAGQAEGTDARREDRIGSVLAGATRAARH